MVKKKKITLKRLKGPVLKQILLRDRRVRDIEKSRLEGLVLKQDKELKVKNGQLKSGEAKHATSEEQLQIRTKAMESTIDGIFIINALRPDFPVIYANQAYQKMTGFRKREIIGKNYFSLYGTDADHRVTDEIKSTIREGKVFHGEMLNFQKNGKKYWDLLRITPVRDARGAVTHYIGIQTDVTLMR